MDRYELTIPPGFVETNAGRLDAFLRARGVPISGVQMAASDDGTPLRIVVIAGRDPTADVAAYVPTATADEIKITAVQTYLRQRVQEITAKAPVNRTQAENDLLALCLLIRDSM